ncbi:MFS transporter [Oceanirhabdus seepicola]|uniref:MFS transporter n=1 Tax=Oceanirhabdus seepicola TaxID=2828781 RepID=A0A9J6P1Q9_9CLOT|nr:MFS transporter [Oceanirhabdus seepicola]MCM1989440.1 MFS transporter [Oceanirhabdus seepicola]
MNSITSAEEIIKKKRNNMIVWKNMILLLLGKLVSLFGSSIYSFAISLYILKTTGSGLNFSLTLAIGTLPRVIFGTVSGVMADRFDRKKMVVCLDILSGMIVLGLLGLSVMDSLRLTYIYIATFLLATCSTFFNTPLTASIPNLVDDENLTRVNSLNEAITSISTIAGPFIGGLVFALIDIRLFLLVNGISFVFSGISEMFLDFNAREKLYGVEEKKNEEKREKKGNGSFWGDLIEGFKYIITQKWLLVFGLFVICFNMFIMMGLTIPVPYIVTKVWGFSPKQLGMLNMMFPVGMLIASLSLSVLPQAKKNYKRIITCILTFSSVIFLVGIITSEIFFKLTNIQYLILLMICYFIMAGSSIFINVPVGVTMQKLIPDDKRGRVFGTIGTLSMGLAPVGAIIGGLLVDTINPWILPIGCGVLMILLTIFMTTVEEIKSI